MPHKIAWRVNKRVLHIQYDGNIDKAELMQLNTELQSYIDHGTAPVHVISDHTNMTKIDISLRSIRENLDVMRSKELGWVLVVGADGVTNFFAQTVTSAFRLKVRMVDSVEDAWDVLRKQDAALPEKMLP